MKIKRFFSKIIIGMIMTLQTFSSAQNFVWAKAMGGANDNIGYSITTDASGNVYTTGFFEGTTDFDPGAGVFNLTSAGSQDIFICKLDAAGNFVWAKAIGGTNNDYGQSITLDAMGNVYTIGSFYATADFDPGAGVFNLTSAASGDIFISKLDATGNFVWAKAMGGGLYDYGLSIALDAVGNIYTTGSFAAAGTADFDPGAGIFNLISAGDDDVFISKLDAAGNFVWAKAIGGTNNDFSSSIALDAVGNVYTSGHFWATSDFDPGAGIFNLTSTGLRDIFICKLDAAGNFVWAKAIGGTDNDAGNSIAISASGNVYTTGYFTGTADFDPGAGAFNLTAAGSQDIFICKLDAAGNFIWAKATGGINLDQGISIDLDASGNVYTTGYFIGTADFDPGAGVFNLTAAGSCDIFISKLDATGNFIWAKSMGGINLDQGISIALDASGNVYTTGCFRGTSDFDPGAGLFNLTPAGTMDIFVHKMNQSPEGIKEITGNINISIYPNPNQGTFKLIIENEIKNGKLILINAIGQKVHEQKISQGQNNIITHDMASGLYNYILLQENGQINNGKLTIE